MAEANDDYDVLNDLEDLTQNNTDPSPKKKKPSATFQTEKLEDRVLYSATWVDAELEDSTDDGAESQPVSKNANEASLSSGEDSNDLFSNNVVFNGSDKGEVFTFDKAQDGDTFQVNGNGGHDAIDLSEFSDDQIKFGQGKMAVSLEDGGSFYVEYKNVEQLSLDGQTHVSVDGASFGGADEGVDKVTVHVGGHQFDGAPKMNIVVDGERVVTDFEVESDQRNGEMEEVIIYGKFGDDGPENIKVEFTNDKWNPNVGDRNLVVDYIEVNGDKLETEDADYLRLNGSEFRDGRDVMSWAGALSFDVEQQDDAIVGTDKSELLRGTEADDVIIGGKGNDRLYGNDGNDKFIYSEGDGVDRFNGGSGTDTVDVSSVEEFTVQHMTKGDSIEQIEGSEKGTKIVGTDGNNHLDFTNTKLNNVTEIDAGAGNDYVKGSQGDDVIVGGKGNDRLYGNDGNDKFIYSEGDGVDRFNGGSGTDTVDASTAKEFTVQHMTKGDSIEQIEGNEKGTKIVGTNGNNHLDFTNTKLNNVTEIDTGAGNDYVKGSQGDDVIVGGKGNDRLYGNDGNDKFIYSEGDGVDRFSGGSGTDTVDASTAKEFTVQHMTKGDSIEQIEGNEKGTKIVGTNGNNHLDFTNTKLNNVTEIDTGAGNDYVKGSQGDDVIVGGKGNDRLYGNDGNDKFIYSEGDGVDRFSGGSGTDTVDASTAKEFTVQHMTKGDSIEQIEGNEKGTKIVGTNGNNHLDFTNTKLNNVTEIDTGAGNDYVKGSQGDDVIVGGKGNDRLYGNDGNDKFIYSEGDGVDRFNGGSGTDTVDASAAKEFTVQHMTKGDSIEQIEGNEKGTKIVGTNGNNHLDFTNTKLNNVTEIDAGAGNDYVKGSQGDDVIVGGKGNDRLYGNDGNDKFIYSEGDGVDRFNGGSGTDTVDVSDVEEFTVQHMTKGDSIEQIEGNEKGTKIVGTNGNNHLDFTNTKLNNVTEIDAGAGNDYVKGSQADDVIVGGKGNDRLYGNDGNDKFIYSEGDGVDRFNGGSGTDTVDVSDVEEFTVQHMTKGDSIEQIEGSEKGTKIVGTDGNNHLDFTNTKLNNVTEIDAGAGNDYVKGSQSDDVIVGGKGNDRLYGNDGNDKFIYSEGDGVDRFNGGSGTDTVDASTAKEFTVQHMTKGDSIEQIEGSEKGTKIVGTDGNNHLDFTNTKLNNVTEIDAGAGNDYVKGSQSDDVIVGGKGNDRLYGNDGNDKFIYSEGDGVDRFNGGSGTDTVDASAAKEFTVQHMTKGDSIEQIEGSEKGTKIVGTNGNNHLDFTNTKLNNVTEIDAGAGNDYVKGSQGDDVFIAGQGNDRFFGNGGDDVVKFSGEYEDYKITELRNGQIRVEDLRDGSPDGVNTIDAVETYKFTDGEAKIGESVVFTHNSLVFEGREIAENSEGGEVVGKFVSSNGDHKYEIVDSEGNAVKDSNFVIRDNAIFVAKGADLDYEQNETVELTVRSTDATGSQQTTTLEIQLSDVNEAPQAENDHELATNEDSPLKISADGLLANDHDQDGDKLSIAKVHDAKNGTVELHDDGTIVFTPSENFSGTASFSYTATTPDGLSTTAEAFIQVNSQNDAVENIELSTKPISEFAQQGTVVGKLTAVDADTNDQHKFEFVDEKGRSVSDSNFEIVGNEVRVKEGAKLDFEGQKVHSVSVRAFDAAGSSTIQSFKLEVANENEGQVVKGESIKIDEDGYAEGNLLENDFDIDGDKLEITHYSQPSHGTVVVDTNGDFIFTPNANFSGTDYFKYEVSDGNGETTTGVVKLGVDAVADGVTIEIAKATGNEDQPIDLGINTILLDDDGSEQVSKIVVSGVPEYAKLSAGENNGDGTWTLTPSDVDGLQLKLSGFGNPDFDLKIEVTTNDGDSQRVQVNSITVDVKNDLFEAAVVGAPANEIEQKTELDEEPEVPQSADPIPTPAPNVDRSNAGFEEFEFEAFNAKPAADIWDAPQSDRSEAFSSEFDAAEATTSFESSQQEVESPIVDFANVELLPPNQLQAVEPMIINAEAIRETEFDVTGLDSENGSAKVTMASLLLLVTTKEENRQKLKDVKKK